MPSIAKAKKGQLQHDSWAARWFGNKKKKLSPLFPVDPYFEWSGNWIVNANAGEWEMIHATKTISIFHEPRTRARLWRPGPEGGARRTALALRVGGPVSAARPIWVSFPSSGPFWVLTIINVTAFSPPSCRSELKSRTISKPFFRGPLQEFELTNAVSGSFQAAAKISRLFKQQQQHTRLEISNSDFQSEADAFVKSPTKYPAKYPDPKKPRQSTWTLKPPRLPHLSTDFF